MILLHRTNKTEYIVQDNVANRFLWLLYVLRKIFTFVERHPVLSVSLYIAVAGNAALWVEFFRLQHESVVRLIFFSTGFYLLIVFLTSLLLQFVKFRYVLKPTLMFVLISSSASAFFMTKYGVYMDVSMMSNVLETDANEVMDLMSFGFFSYVLLLGIIPAIFIYRLKIQYLSFHRQVIKNGLTIAICSIGIVGNAVLFYGDYASLFRNHHHIRYLVNPVNYLYGMGAVIGQNFINHAHATVEVGLDSKHNKQSTSTGKRSVIVLVVGETARAMNFSLNGYSRETNPRLAKEDIINYPNTHSCGTSTHTSLPCMFMHFKRTDYDEGESVYYEKLPDVLKHAGIDVLWRDNNSGCKGVCKNVKTDIMYNLKLPKVCNDHECYDEVLLNGLQEIIDSGDKDLVIVLHQKGSHGPAYYLRYPEAFKVFTPECQSAELSSCQKSEVVNAYDNTIRYTDYFLSKVIGILKQNAEKYNTAMLYMSDHGESLGENNIYLHSLPYFIAPKEQTDVPFITWYSEGFLKEQHLNKNCLRENASQRVSHDNLFHSILGLTNVTTNVYDANLDIYKDCRLQKTLSVTDAK